MTFAPPEHGEMRLARGPGMNHWGASNRALSTFTHSHLPSCGWPVPAASAPCLHYLQNAYPTVDPYFRKSESPKVRKSDDPFRPDSGLRTPDSGLTDRRTYRLPDLQTAGLSANSHYRQTEFANRAARPARERASSVAASEKPNAIAHSSAHSTSMAEARAMRKNRCWLAEPCS